MRVLLLKNTTRLPLSNNLFLKAAQRSCTLCSNHFQIFYLNWIFIAWFIVYSNQSYADTHDIWEKERVDYLQARLALSKHKINQFSAYKAELTNYPLYPYLVYDDLIARLSRVSDAEVNEFITIYNDTPLSNRLRLTWLVHLQKKGKWKKFINYYKEDDSTALRCYFLRAKIRQGDIQKHITQIRDIWLVGKSQPKQCDPLFKWYEDEEYLNDELIWERFALAMESNRPRLAKYLAKKLSEPEQAKAELWLTTHSNPKRHLLSRALQKDSHLNRQIVRHGLKRYARKDLTAAHEAWATIRENYAFGSDLHDEIERNLALRAAYRHDKRATTWMYELPKEVVDASTGMWRARSAIRSQDWDLVLRGIAMLSEEEKAQEQWQYWKARALEEQGMQSDASEIYQSIAAERSYYGFLAADKIATPYNIDDIPVQYSFEEFEEIAKLPAIIRTRELLLVDQFADARREWNFVTKSFTER